MSLHGYITTLQRPRWFMFRFTLCLACCTGTCIMASPQLQFHRVAEPRWVLCALPVHPFLLPALDKHSSPYCLHSFAFSRVRMFGIIQYVLFLYWLIYIYMHLHFICIFYSYIYASFMSSHDLIAHFFWTQNNIPLSGWNNCLSLLFLKDIVVVSKFCLLWIELL